MRRRILVATVCGVATMSGASLDCSAGLLENKDSDRGTNASQRRDERSRSAGLNRLRSPDRQPGDRSDRQPGDKSDRQPGDRSRDPQRLQPQRSDQPFFKFDATVIPFMTKPCRVPSDYPRMPPYIVAQRLYKRNRQAALNLQNSAARQASFGNWTDAVKLYQDSLQEDPSSVSCRKALAEALAHQGNAIAKSGQWEDALQYLLQSEFVDRDHPTAAKDADACLSRAGGNPRSVESWRDLAGRFEERALYQPEAVCYRRCAYLLRKPVSDDLPGSSYLKSNLPVVAFKELVRAVAPVSPINDRSTLQACHRTLGFVLLDLAQEARMSGSAPTADSRLINASGSFRRALAYDRNDTSALYGLLSICAEAIQEKPVATNFSILGATYHMLGDTTRARLAYAEVLKREPLNLLANQNMKMLERKPLAMASDARQQTDGNDGTSAGGAVGSAAVQPGKGDERSSASGAGKGRGDAAISTPVTEKWALVVGINRFQDPKLNLVYAVNDAKSVYDFLTTSGNFAPDHVILLTDEQATRSRILALVGDKWLPRAARPDDLVVIYFSTHGSPAEMDVGGSSYLITYDTEPDNLYATGISMQDFARIIRTRAHAKRVVMILDCCHSGAADPAAKGLFREKGFDAGQLSQGTGHLVICSSSPDQRSWESQRYKGSVFTHHLIDALKKNGAATRLGDAFPLIRTQVQEEVQRDRGVMQTPVLKSQWQGDDLMMSATPTDPRPALEMPGTSGKASEEPR